MRWTIPADRAKNGLPHIVQLSDYAIQILEDVPVMTESSKLFPARNNPQNGPSGFSKVVRRLKDGLELKLGREVDDWRLHDVRRTVATGLQRLGVRFEVTEAVLNHTSGAKSGVAGVYQRYDWQREKQEALELWAREIIQITSAP